MRELNESDFQALYSVLADSDIMRHYPYTFDENRVRGWITKNIERYGNCGITMQNINGAL